jgi:N-acetyl-alpha-D-muramate 1-phosphate uridylyltransferase
MMDGALERPARAMILAAGRGERMRPLTDRLPKPLLEVGGKPLIQYHIERLARAGLCDIVINLAWLGSMIRNRLGDGSALGARITYSEESPRALETAGGIFRALPLLGTDPFLVMNGDIFTDYPVAHAGLAPGRDAHIVLVPNPPQHAAGDFGLEHGLARAAGSPRYTFSGIAVYRPEFFAACVDGVFPLLPLLVRSMAAQRCSADLYTGLWEDVGTPERLAALNARLG